jgi:hypothetical protein
VLLAETHDRSRVKFLDNFHTPIVRVVLSGSSHGGHSERIGITPNTSSCIAEISPGSSVKALVKAMVPETTQHVWLVGSGTGNADSARC